MADSKKKTVLVECFAWQGPLLEGELNLTQG